MFEVLTGSRSALCDGSSRRDVLRAGLFGLVASALVPHLRASDPAAAGPLVRDRSVIFLFLAGGPSQYETFDPKPDGPEGSTSINGHVPTAIPGVRFSAYLPKLAKLADRLTVVRSFQTKHPEHNGATGFEELETTAGGRAVRRLQSNAAIPGNKLTLAIDIKLHALV